MNRHAKRITELYLIDFLREHTGGPRNSGTIVYAVSRVGDFREESRIVLAKAGERRPQRGFVVYCPQN